MDRKTEHPASARASLSDSCSPERDHTNINRRQFGSLIASAGVAAFWVAKPAMSAMVGSSSAAEPSIRSEILTLKTQQAIFSIDATGAFSAIASNGRNLLATGQPSPVLSIQVIGKMYQPNRAAWNSAGGTLILDYSSISARVVVAVRTKLTHVTFELTELHTVHYVELVLWGPYPTVIGDLVGEVVGVVRDSRYAMGIQALNVKTLGGYPCQKDDIQPDFRADDPGIYPGLPRALKKQQLWRGTTAKHMPFGSTLQAYCRNRDQKRIIRNWGYKKFVALPYGDGGVIGSKIALFAGSATTALSTLGEIEVAEGLPHPTMDGKWAKIAWGATSSYLIVDFGESTIDTAIEMTRRAGLKYLYHSSPFRAWGHFELKPHSFPQGWSGFRECVEKARKAGIGVGFHTLSNFITPNDPYVTPKPNPGLARVGTSSLPTDIDETDTEVPVVDPTWFQKKTTLNTAVIGEELIRYEDVSTSAPWQLLDCQRGAWGTKAAPHRKGDGIGKLIDHPYKVFLTDATLSKEVAHNIARFCNYTGATQLSLDGLEGNWSTGMGQYGCSLFTDAWYGALKLGLRGHVINDASNPHHFTWHIATRYNWGEPWYAGFRQSQTLYRLKNQLFFTRNLLPHMLGWFVVRRGTTVEDVEWLCARGAGYDAGFALATSFESKAQQSSAKVTSMDKQKAAIFEVIKQWETARESRAFPESLKPNLQDVNREFHLQKVRPGEWDLKQVNPPGRTVRIKARSTNIGLASAAAASRGLL